MNKSPQPMQRSRFISDLNPALWEWFAAAFLCFGIGPSYAQPIVIDFDPPQFAAGQQLSSVGIVTFPDNPVVFAAPSTFTPPNALRSTQGCATPACSSGAYMLRLRFAQLLSALSMKVGNFGVQSPPLCIGEDYSCNVAARLEAFDVNGNMVGDSGDVIVGGANTGPITTDMSVTDAAGRIASATLFMNKGTAHSDYGDPVPAQVDHLVFESTGVPTPTGGGPVSITITAPTPLQSFSYPFNVTFAGTVSAPSGVLAFCTALNNTTAPAVGQCNQVGSLDGGGRFTLAIAPSVLAAGTNTLSAFAYDFSNQLVAASVSFSLQAPAAPSISISAPTADYCLEGVVPTSFVWGVVQSGVCTLSSPSNVTLSGGGSIPGGLLGFCTGANEPVAPPASQCTQHAGVINGTLNFLNVPVPASALLSGVNTLDAYAYDLWGRLAEAHVQVVLPADPQIVAMEVTQGIQSTAIPLNTPGTPVPYSGARLFAGGKTIVRVFANTTAGTLPGVDVWLLGTRDQFDTGVQNQLLGLLFPDNGALDLSAGGTTVSLDWRADPNGAYVFTLPSDWVAGGGGSITLYAVVNPKGFDIPPIPSCSGCQANSLMTLTGVSFENLSPITINPVEITWKDSSGTHSPNSNPAAVFAAAASISPLSTGTLTVLPYLGTIDISDFVFFASNNGKDSQWLSGVVLDLVSEVEDIQNPPGYLIGVSKAPGACLQAGGCPTDLGLESPHVYSWPPRISDIAVVDEGRPLASAAHEFFHQLHYYHAGMDPACSVGFPAVGWPPDNRGDIQGIGLDRNSGSGPLPGTYRIIAPGAQHQFSEVVDFMSYCGRQDDANLWISLRNWNAWGSFLPNGVIPGCDLLYGCANATISEAPLKPHQSTLRVRASVDPAGTATILSVRPGSGTHTVSQSNAADRSGLNIVVRDAAGGVVSRTPVSPIASDRWQYVNAEVLATGAARVEIERGGTPVAHRDRSAHAPTIKLLAPTPGSKLSGTSVNLIKWLANDADGDPLVVRVEYSADGGKNYRVVTGGVRGNQVALPGSLFSRSRDARIRLRVNDGFNEGVAVSGLLTAKGSPPSIRIAEPVAGTHFRNDVRLTLIGEAYNDAGKPIPAEKLKWYDGTRVLGQGRRLSVFDRRAGQRSIRLVARDADREATASVDVFVDAVTPTFVGLQVPEKVPHGEDEVRIAVGSSIPGVVVIGGNGYQVATKPRVLTVRIPRGTEDLAFPIVLVAEGKTVTRLAHIKRD